MASGRETKLTGATGEYLVAAELCRLGMVAAPFAGNVPHYDIIASDPRGGHLAVQVKTSRGSNWQLDARSFLDITLKGQRQILGRAKREPYPSLACVLVLLGDGVPDRFFILTWRNLRNIVVRRYRGYLKRHNYVRPKSPGSFHTKVDIENVVRFERQWRFILPRVR